MEEISGILVRDLQSVPVASIRIKAPMKLL